MLILVGKHVLLWDHPNGHNKIQDRYKPDIYVVVGHHQDPNVYYIQLLNSDHKGHPKVVNHCQLYDLNWSCPPLNLQALSLKVSMFWGFHLFSLVGHLNPTFCTFLNL